MKASKVFIDTNVLIYQTNISAVVIANKLDYLWTFNTKDFVKFNEIQLLQDTLPT